MNYLWTVPGYFYAPYRVTLRLQPAITLDEGHVLGVVDLGGWCLCPLRQNL
jgi:hypothetical protein